MASGPVPVISCNWRSSGAAQARRARLRRREGLGLARPGDAGKAGEDAPGRFQRRIGQDDGVNPKPRPQLGYRVTFRWESGHAFEVDVEDYH